jgi:hypothetical protein
MTPAQELTTCINLSGRLPDRQRPETDPGIVVRGSGCAAIHRLNRMQTGKLSGRW